jgi:hypothetical protein
LGLKFAPDSNHSNGESEGWGAFGYLDWGLAMGHAYPRHSKQERLDGSPLECDEYSFDEHADDVVSVLEENARLRSLVVKLSEVILRNVADKR